MNNMGPSLHELLMDRKKDVVGEWLQKTLQAYPESAGRFLTWERDPFRNPVGHTLKEGLAALFDLLARGDATCDARPVLDSIVRIRAVQDFTASQAVGFLFPLKQILRSHFQDDLPRGHRELDDLDCRIDELALLAFDLFMECRQRIYQIKADEARRSVSALERAIRSSSTEPTG